MIIVDTHTHAGPNWFEPVEMLVQQMHLNGVDKAVLFSMVGLNMGITIILISLSA